MFVPSGSEKVKVVSLEFENGDCHVCVEGVRILTLSGDQVLRAPFVSEEITGFKLDDRGRVLFNGD